MQGVILFYILLYLIVFVPGLIFSVINLWIKNKALTIVSWIFTCLLLCESIILLIVHLNRTQFTNPNYQHIDILFGSFFLVFFLTLQHHVNNSKTLVPFKIWYILRSIFLVLFAFNLFSVTQHFLYANKYINYNSSFQLILTITQTLGFITHVSISGLIIYEYLRRTEPIFSAKKLIPKSLILSFTIYLIAVVISRIIILITYDQVTFVLSYFLGILVFFLISCIVGSAIAIYVYKNRNIDIKLVK